MIATQEFLSFLLEGEEYGVPILDVREVRGWNTVREVPNSPAYMKGVLEIRGEYVPIVDLRMRFGLAPATISVTTVVIVLNDAQHQPLGIIVDGVSEVYPLTEEQIKPSPYVSSDVDHSYVRGIASVSNGHLVLINLDALFDAAELVVPDQAEESWA
ncbi:chemotaxis protein CheW [Vibrio brasiliensis]|uniref:Chemotaxis protein CheW n=1 Tax=Vibrio brasiliensis LMG 20546 TaxID=945543 RepID=E8LVT9_9VIBR|nr:chemotaxis protein CheW [Vibrio brasiliensis]EGA65195.1 chemotaxis signal transduction protein [Vibrio brasiliensis LMG 20546]MCG9647559.1 chemotaxis protein CheW [Vibrio brasiliensis]MCG9726358.1 chemotaxis protein CheW [Vibrio brasiliensis]|tara:strand:+ start:267 stop:737 length:471 start_codon:yes stop_codon:yes gene_type:complete